MDIFPRQKVLVEMLFIFQYQYIISYILIVYFPCHVEIKLRYGPRNPRWMKRWCISSMVFSSPHLIRWSCSAFLLFSLFMWWLIYWFTISWAIFGICGMKLASLQCIIFLICSWILVGNILLRIVCLFPQKRLAYNSIFAISSLFGFVSGYYFVKRNWKMYVFF